MNSKIALLFFFTVVFSDGDEECKDVVDFCYLLDSRGKCDLAIAKRYCRRICKHCTEPLLGPAEPTESCQDESSNCEQRFWVCATLPIDAAKCKLTCEHCKSLPGKPQTALPTTPVPRPPPRPHIPGCEDEDHLCYRLDDANMCYLDITKVKCHHSCGHCQSKLTRMPDPTPECYDIDRDCDEEFFHCIAKGEKAYRCRQTCGLCATSVVPPPPSTLPARCRDQILDCDDVKQQNLCDTELADLCPSTCGKCQNCEDKDECTELAAKGLCSEKSFAETCPKACNSCSNQTS